MDSRYFSNRYAASSAPSAKVSRRPTRRSGRPNPASASVSATAEPSPPTIEWFSAVTTARVAAATVRIVAVSSGFSTGTSTTEAETPALRRTGAAASAVASIIPLATSATSVPASSTRARLRDSGGSWSSTITGTSPRLSRT